MPRTERRKTACHCINVRRAAGAVTEYYDRTLRPTGLTVAQFSLLSNIRQSGTCSVSELAARVGLERTTLARDLKSLFAAGWIRDDAAPGTRNRRLAVTPAGWRTLDAAIPLWEEAQRGVAARIGVENLALLTYLLARLESL